MTRCVGLEALYHLGQGWARGRRGRGDWAQVLVGRPCGDDECTIPKGVVGHGAWEAMLRSGALRLRAKHNGFGQTSAGPPASTTMSCLGLEVGGGWGQMVDARERKDEPRRIKESKRDTREPRSMATGAGDLGGEGLSHIMDHARVGRGLGKAAQGTQRIREDQGGRVRGCFAPSG